MAAAASWRSKLNSHPLVQQLKRKTTKSSLNKQNTDAKSLICVYGSDLYVWDVSEGQVLHCNLKTLVEHDGDKEKLIISDGFTYDVEGISINRCGSHLVVWGSHGVRVVELPRRWGKNAMFEGGKEAVTCRTVCIEERTLSSTHSLRVKQVTWHPGSKTDSHLALLTSDNMLSVYDIQQPDHPISTINVNTGDVSVTHSPSRSLVGAALGDIAVAFDFGPPIILQPKPRVLQMSAKIDPIEVWPVYCLRGSGEVMLLYSHLSQFSLIKLPVQGPLMMYPPAEDNYGVDACSILCLPTPFPVVIISTCEGRVHHCVQLPGTLDIDTTQSDISSPIRSVSNTSLHELPAEPVLYVIETAELELCLKLPRFDGDVSFEDDFMCPVLLKKDNSCFDRYHCAHAAGVHSVALPWLGTVEHYFTDESGDFNMPEEKECVVEHLICTKPLVTCPTSPVLGVEVVSDPVLGPTLLILSSDYEFTALPIGLHYRLSSLHTAEDAGVNAGLLSPLRYNSREPFSKQMEQILQKRTSNPLLKSGNISTLSQQDCFQLLSRATQVLREEYIQRQDLARQELDTRINILREHKEHQLQDLKRLIDSRHILREHARTIAERLETCKDDHENLLKRLESVLRKIQSRVPVLSEAERHMAKELTKIKDNIQLYVNSIEQVRVKQQYQERQITKSSSTESPVLQKKQLSQIYDVLKDEGEDIDKLKCDLGRLNIAFS
ncbi:unnamed protein product [Candidula unifasciata]|uniref:Nuclear pore complex protein Nup88 n=1 Tax=Candidula unifasciata TaxID=100452 RepID=A0A8S3ZJL3_9EUPU|nr:unnamed protein product [Candidula unifasciata]